MSTMDQSLSATTPDDQGEREQSRRLAERYRCPLVDLFEVRIDPELFRSIPAELMFRFNFVPLEAQNGALVIAVADPSQVLLSDELPLLLGKKLILKIATPTQISDLLKRTEQSQRVLDQASEAFTLQVVEEEEDIGETISADRLTRDSAVSPVVRLVDTVIFTALERRASDIHIEARDVEVIVKYRKGHERAGHRREARPPGWQIPCPIQGPLRGFPSFHHALHPRRRRRPTRSRQGDVVGEVSQPQPGRGGLFRGGSAQAAAVYP